MDYLADRLAKAKKPEETKPEPPKTSSPLDRRMGNLDRDKGKKISDSFKKTF